MTDEHDVFLETAQELSKELREFSRLVQKIDTRQEGFRRELDSLKSDIDDLSRNVAQIDQRLTQAETEAQREPKKLEQLPDTAQLDTEFDQYVTKQQARWFGFGVFAVVTVIQLIIAYLATGGF